MLTRNKILSVLKCKIIDVLLEENNFQVLQRAIVIFPFNIFLQPNKDEEKIIFSARMHKSQLYTVQYFSKSFWNFRIS